MKKIIIAVLSLTLAWAASAQTNVGVDSNSSSQSGAVVNASNGGINIFNPAAPSQYKYDYGTQTIKNTPSFGLGSFSNSLSPDFCAGVAQAAISTPGFGIGGGGPIDVASCIGFRGVDKTGNLSAAFGQSSIAALALSTQMKTGLNCAAPGTKEVAERCAAADAVYDAAIRMGMQSQALANAAILIMCQIDRKFEVSYTAVGYDCTPVTGKTEEERKAAALKRGESPDPLVRLRQGLAPL